MNPSVRADVMDAGSRPRTFVPSRPSIGDLGPGGRVASEHDVEGLAVGGRLVEGGEGGAAHGLIRQQLAGVGPVLGAKCVGARGRGPVGVRGELAVVDQVRHVQGPDGLGRLPRRGLQPGQLARGGEPEHVDGQSLRLEDRLARRSFVAERERGRSARGGDRSGEVGPHGLEPTPRAVAPFRDHHTRPALHGDERVPVPAPRAGQQRPDPTGRDLGPVAELVELDDLARVLVVGGGRPEHRAQARARPGPQAVLSPAPGSLFAERDRSHAELRNGGRREAPRR